MTGWIYLTSTLATAFAIPEVQNTLPITSPCTFVKPWVALAQRERIAEIAILGNIPYYSSLTMANNKEVGHGKETGSSSTVRTESPKFLTLLADTFSEARLPPQTAKKRTGLIR